MVNFSLEGKVALVTGAAHGIGFSIATALAEAGARIIFNSSGKESMERGIKKYRELNIDARGFVCDVTNEDQVNDLVAQVTREVGVIDILVNNAGIIKRVP
ncbi:MAG: SDR family NAD(P)-dependent oxidoreductase, partial [Proteiniphilum sp.]